MDNFHIDITSEGDLRPALAIAFGRFHTVTHYAIRDAETEDPPQHRRPNTRRSKRLVFYWSDSQKRDDLIALPFKLDVEGASDFARRWLAEQDYGREPDHDGDNGKGWRVYNESWGHVDGDWSAFVAVAPVWAMYGK